jgi:hypothetical protein
MDHLHEAEEQEEDEDENLNVELLEESEENPRGESLLLEGLPDHVEVHCSRNEEIGESGEGRIAFLGHESFWYLQPQTSLIQMADHLQESTPKRVKCILCSCDASTTEADRNRQWTLDDLDEHVKSQSHSRGEQITRAVKTISGSIFIRPLCHEDEDRSMPKNKPSSTSRTPTRNNSPGTEVLLMRWTKIIEREGLN